MKLNRSTWYQAPVLHVLHAIQWSAFVTHTSYIIVPLNQIEPFIDHKIMAGLHVSWSELVDILYLILRFIFII
jgi:hypothetical protein